ncbi:serine threonine-protein phosphatase 4 regulatory subunit 4-like [Stylonychia lemnae]|uniref:Serine threonine-protein phosphatase 4 regulatory subunit 4-like n=1 Tax=Stylonychia lemnae TaxID=5949 RepID=A0A078BC97_STYLE|nr:serine threonine-protein phosphatase 4 regulatory subunit 4-like [Stylonychia lemnae]|eukprot:CDW91821.1 serine threonine-protein phosphatase 4 regulatory subunit 4-like [Stylonychia lemnae]
MNSTKYKLPIKEDEINEFNLPQIRKQVNARIDYSLNLGKVEYLQLQQRGLGDWSEEIQIQAGEAFITLLKQKILDSQFFKELLKVASQMMKQWSKSVLMKWIEVYAILLPRITCEDQANADKFERDCLELVNKMGDQPSPFQVKISVPFFLAQLAKNQSIRQKDTYTSRCLSKIKNMCQDFNWEIRKEMCLNLTKISKYLGHQLVTQIILPELIELLNDEEVEVFHQAIQTYIKFNKKILTQEQKQGAENLATIKKILMHVQNLNTQGNIQGDSEKIQNEVKQTVYKNLNDLILIMRNKDDEGLIDLIYDCLKINLLCDNNKMIIAECLQGLCDIYGNNVKLLKSFYLPLYQSFIKEAFSGEDNELKDTIAAKLHHLILNTLMISDSSIGSLDSIKNEILDFYVTAIKCTRKETVNNIIVNADEVMKFFITNQNVIDKPIYKFFLDKIRKPLISTVLEKKLQNNWRYLVNYYEFLQKLFKYVDRDDTTLEIFPLCVKGLKQTYCPFPVKKYIAQSFANVIGKHPNNFLRQSIQEAMIKDFASSRTYQNRMIFLCFVENLLPQISKTYFKQTFMESLLRFKDEETIQLLIVFVRLIPQIRLKMDEYKSQDKIDQILNQIMQKYSSKIVGRELVSLANEIQQKIREPEYLDEVMIYQNVKDKELYENELRLSTIEREEKDSSKRKEMESMIKQMKDDYMKKMHNVNSSSGTTLGTSSFLLGALKDNRAQSSMKAERKPISISGAPSVGLNMKLSSSSSTKGNKTDKVIKEESKSSLSNYGTSSVAAKKNLQTQQNSLMPPKPGSQLKKR